MTGDDTGAKPVLWVSCTAKGRGPQEMGGGHKPDGEALEQIKDELEEQMGDRYEIVVADDKLRLLDADEIRDLLKDLQEQASQFAHEDALFEAATEGDDGE
jgi:hypothetical protein